MTRCMESAISHVIRTYCSCPYLAWKKSRKRKPFFVHKPIANRSQSQLNTCQPTWNLSRLLSIQCMLFTYPTLRTNVLVGKRMLFETFYSNKNFFSVAFPHRSSNFPPTATSSVTSGLSVLLNFCSRKVNWHTLLHSAENCHAFKWEFPTIFYVDFSKTYWHRLWQPKMISKAHF